MSRQPYLPAYSRLHFTIAHTSLADRPELASILGQCLGVWEQAETLLGLCLGALLGSDSDAAVTVFNELRKAGVQRKVLESAAATVLQEDDCRLVTAVWRICHRAETHRNELAHGIFGHLEATNAAPEGCPDALVWCEGKHYAVFLNGHHRRAKNPPPGWDPHAELRPHLFVYRKKDLEDAYQQMVDARQVAFALHDYLRHREAAPEIRTLRHTRLINLPAVAQELARLGR